MSIPIQRFLKKPFEVEAVRVTEENFEDVRAWCDGVANPGDKNGPFFKVDVRRPLSDRQTRAYVGDWVLHAANGFKVYTNNAFRQFFEPVTDGVLLVNHRVQGDVFPDEPKEMTEELDLPFNVIDHTAPRHGLRSVE